MLVHYSGGNGESKWVSERLNDIFYYGTSEHHMTDRLGKPDQGQRDDLESGQDILVKSWWLQLRESRKILRLEHCVAHQHFPF